MKGVHSKESLRLGTIQQVTIHPELGEMETRSTIATLKKQCFLRESGYLNYEVSDILFCLFCCIFVYLLYINWYALILLWARTTLKILNISINFHGKLRACLVIQWNIFWLHFHFIWFSINKLSIIMVKFIDVIYPDIVVNTSTCFWLFH